MSLHRFLIALIILVSPIFANAQINIAVQNGENVSFYNSLDSAVTNAESGSTIYLPGGVIDVPNNFVIDKKVNLVGAGHHPEYTKATGRTYLDDDITFTSGADSGSVTGVYIDGTLYFGTNADNQNFSSFSITRCNVYRIRLAYNTSNSSENFLISENIIRRNIIGNNVKNVLILKNIMNNVGTFIIDDYSVQIKNNIFYRYNYGDPLYRLQYCRLENNIIIDGDFPFDECSNNILNNNLFNWNITFPFNGNDGVENIVGIDADSIFVDRGSGAFDYYSDLHLLESCPGVEAGTDGYDIGIYGTSVPYKEGAIPQYPWIKKAIIPSETENGVLRIEMTVEAQTR